MLYEMQNFHKVALYMDTSQATISHRLSSLEKEIGAPLFERTTKAVIPTRLCHDILPFIKQAVKAEEGIFNAVKSNTEDIHIRMGVVSTFANSWFVDWLKHIGSVHSNITFEFIVDTSLTLENILENEEVDLIFSNIYKDSSDYVFHYLCTYPTVFIASPEYQAEHLADSFSLDKLNNIPIFTYHHTSQPYQNFIKALTERSTKRPQIHSSTSIGLIKKAVINGLGIGLLTAESIRNELASKELVIIAPEKNLLPPLKYYVGHKSHKHIPYLQDIIDSAKQYAESVTVLNT